MAPADSPDGHTHPSRRGTYANGERTRAALVEAAFDVFATQGFQRMSMRQIAEAIGTSHTALARHFGSRDALLDAVLERRSDHDAPERNELVRSRGLLEAVPSIMRSNAEIRGVIQLDMTLRCEALDTDHPAQASVRNRQAAFNAAVRTALDAEAEAGRLREGLDLNLVAGLITSAVSGVQMAWLEDPDFDMAAHLAQLMDLIRAKPDDS